MTANTVKVSNVETFLPIMLHGFDLKCKDGGQGVCLQMTHVKLKQTISRFSFIKPGIYSISCKDHASIIFQLQHSNQSTDYIAKIFHESEIFNGTKVFGFRRTNFYCPCD